MTVNNAAAVNNTAAVIAFNGADMFAKIRWYSLPGNRNPLCSVHNGNGKEGMKSSITHHNIQN
jgi:hypothetical protein